MTLNEFHFRQNPLFGCVSYLLLHVHASCWLIWHLARHEIALKFRHFNLELFECYYLRDVTRPIINQHLELVQGKRFVSDWKNLSSTIRLCLKFIRPHEELLSFFKCTEACLIDMNLKSCQYRIWYQLTTFDILLFSG